MAVNPVGSEFQVNTTTARVQQLPTIAIDSDGDFVVTWTSYFQPGDDQSGVYAQRYNNAGVAQGGEFRVNTFTDNFQYEPTIGIDSDGDFAIAWTSGGQDGSGYGIYAQRYNSAGSPQGGEFQVNTATNDNQSAPSLGMSANGNFVVSWTSNGQDGSEGGVYAQRYNSDGTVAGSEFRVNTTTNGSQAFPSVAMNANGNFIITWQSNGQDGSGAGIYAQRYDSNGSAVGGEFRVNTFTADDQRSPSVSMNDNGAFVIVWESASQDGSQEGVYAQRYDSNGAAVGAEFQVNTFTTGQQKSPEVTMENSGGFFITWESAGQDGDADGVYARQYNSQGQPQGAEFQVNTETANDQNNPAIAVSDNGRLAIAWESEVQDGDATGIYAQRYLSNTLIEFSEATYQVNEDGSLVNGEITLNRSGNLDVTSQVQVNITGGTATGGANGDYDNSNFPLTVTFNPNETTKTVPVTIQQDSETESTETINFNLDNLSNAELGSQSTTVLEILDDDIPGLKLEPQTGLTTTEAGGTANFNVSLNTQPTADVTVNLTSNDTSEGTVSPATLTFTSQNWNVTQAVTLTGVNDQIADGNIDYTIAVSASSSDTNYNTLSPSQVTATNVDNDTVGITVNPTTGLTTTEAGGTAQFSVVLNTQPTADVTIPVSSSDTTEGTVAPQNLVFTPSNWDTVQTVTVTGVADNLEDGDIAYQVLLAAATSTDTNYNGIDPSDVSVTNAEVGRVIVEETGGSTAIAEGGNTDTYTLRLSRQPIGNVIVGVTPDNQSTAAPSTIIFTPNSWNIAQTVTLTAVDDNVTEGNHSSTISHTVNAPSDPGYNNSPVPTVTATITDNDTGSPSPGSVSFVESGGSTNLTEGGATDSYTLVLTQQPSANVTITATPDNQSTVNPTTFTFTPANWNTPQTATLTAVDDTAVEGNHSSTIRHTSTSTDASFNNITLASVTAAIADNDTTPTPTPTPTPIPLSPHPSISLYYPH